MAKEEQVDLSRGNTNFLHIYLSKKQIMINNFLGGIAWAIGATIGIAIIVAILTIIAKHINVIPFIGSFVSNLIDYVLKTNSHFK